MHAMSSPQLNTDGGGRKPRVLETHITTTELKSQPIREMQKMINPSLFQVLMIYVA